MRAARWIVAGAATLFLGSAGWTLSYTVPDESFPAILAGEDMALVQANCTACHSLDYIASQPRGKDATFWKGIVTKMVHTYGAPVTPEDEAKVADLLTQKLGKVQ